MSSAQPPNQPPNNPPTGEKPDEQQSLLGQTPPEARPAEDAAMDTAPDQPPEETWDDIPEEIVALTTEDIQTRTRLIDNDIKVTFLCPTDLPLVRSSHLPGYEIRNDEVTTRTERHEGKDQRQRREDKAEQSSAVSRWKRRRGLYMPALPQCIVSSRPSLVDSRRGPRRRRRGCGSRS